MRNESLTPYPPLRLARGDACGGDGVQGEDGRMAMCVNANFDKIILFRIILFRIMDGGRAYLKGDSRTPLA